jgi:DNA-directed RNA polymerase subunit RPC12/RpoP
MGKKTQAKAYVCATCGALAEAPGHLCNPQGEPLTCKYCGKKHEVHEKHFCKGKLEDIKYVCKNCGRLATSADFLCKPQEVPNI